MLDFRVYTFLTVCQEMNYTRAAELLSITQPNVSQHIKWLEEAYQQKLFVYQGRKLVLTEAGRMLREAAVSMSHEEELLHQQMKNFGSGQKRLSFGVTKSMRRQIEKLLQKYAGDKIRFTVNNTHELLEDLNERMLDFAIVEGNFDKKLYDYVVLKEDNFIPVCAPDYPFKRPVSCMKDLLEETLIIRESGSGSREIFEHMMGSRNYTSDSFASVMEIGEIGAIKKLLAAGKGITFVYETAVEEELKNRKLRRIPLEDVSVCHEFSVIWLKTEYFSDYYREIAQELL